MRERCGSASGSRLGLSIDAGSDTDRAALATKVDQVVDAGARLVALCLDDIPFGGADQGAAHGALAAALADHLGDRARLVLVPTEYVGIRRTPYLAALAAAAPVEVPIGWTGDAVVNDAITTRQAERRADALDGRPPLVWDNVPVNDGLVTERLHLGPLWGRDSELLEGDLIAGYLANPMVQPSASLLPLASIAAWLRGDDPLDAWAAEADRRGWHVFAEACDGAVPHALVSLAADAFTSGKLRVDDLEPLRAWFADAAEATAPGLEDECAGWIEQVHREAAVAIAALELVQRSLGDSARSCDVTEVAETIGLIVRWQRLQWADVAVMGPVGDRRSMHDRGPSLEPSCTKRRKSTVDARWSVVGDSYRTAASPSTPSPGPRSGAEGRAVTGQRDVLGETARR